MGTFNTSNIKFSKLNQIFQLSIFSLMGQRLNIKIKQIFIYLNTFLKKFILRNSTWNYPAAGHGKRVADAIGGTVKKLCDNHVSFGKNILCAKDMIDTVNHSVLLRT